MRINKNKNSSPLRKKMAKYAVGGGVGDDKKKTTAVKRSGTGEDKPGLKALEGTGEYNKPTWSASGKPYTGKVYLEDKKKKYPIKKPTPPPVERATPKFSGRRSTAKGLADGGEVDGEGTETSDSNEAVIKKGSFIIPAAIRSKLKNMLNSGKKANMNQSGGIQVKLSKGEEVVEPGEAKEIDSGLKKGGVKKGINMLAPKSRRKFSARQFRKNGM